MSGVFPVLLTTGLDGKAIAWDRSSLASRQTFEHPTGVICMEAVRESPLFVTGCVDGGTRVWDARLATSVRLLHGSDEPVQCLALDKDQQLLMTGSDDGSVRVFDLRS